MYDLLKMEDRTNLDGTDDAKSSTLDTVVDAVTVIGTQVKVRHRKTYVFF